MKDSGQRDTFASGAVRDTADDKPRPDLISPFAAERLGVWLAAGAKKYAERNWEKGIPMSRVLASLERHLIVWKQGMHDEDHLAAIMCNAMFLLDYDERIQRCLLDDSINDMPKYWEAVG